MRRHAVDGREAPDVGGVRHGTDLTVMLGGQPEEALSWLSRAGAMAAQVGADHGGEQEGAVGPAAVGDQDRTAPAQVLLERREVAEVGEVRQ